MSFNDLQLFTGWVQEAMVRISNLGGLVNGCRLILIVILVNVFGQSLSMEWMLQKFLTMNRTVIPNTNILEAINLWGHTMEGIRKRVYELRVM